MKDEIKEILDFKENADYKRLSIDEIIVIKDCITNLQTKFDMEKKINDNNSEAYLKLLHSEEMYKQRIDKAIEIYKNRNTCKYKKERFMEDKSTSDLMYEELLGGDDNE